MPDDNLTAEQYEEWAQRYTTLAAWYEQHRMTELAERARARAAYNAHRATGVPKAAAR